MSPGRVMSASDEPGGATPVPSAPACWRGRSSSWAWIPAGACNQAAVVTAVQPVVPLVLTYIRVLVLLPSVRM